MTIENWQILISLLAVTPLFVLGYIIQKFDDKD